MATSEKKIVIMSIVRFFHFKGISNLVIVRLFCSINKNFLFKTNFPSEHYMADEDIRDKFYKEHINETSQRHSCEVSLPFGY